jgi:hypothetical protein
VNLVGVDEPLAAFLNESRTRGDCLVPRTGNPGISPAFGEMWEMKLLSRASLQVTAHFRGSTKSCLFIGSSQLARVKSVEKNAS